MNDFRIELALTGPSSGYVIAILPPPDGHWSGARLVVGDVRDLSAYDQPEGFPRKGPEAWKAWLWPEAGGALHVTQTCQAAEAGSAEKLLEKIRRTAKAGPWWRDGAA